MFQGVAGPLLVFSASAMARSSSEDAGD